MDPRQGSDFEEFAMMNRMMSMLRVAPLLVGSLSLFAGCEPAGPAEKAGENIDRAVDNAAEAVNPSGPAEKAGENIDKALGK
jgi:hypothetical protein